MEMIFVAVPAGCDVDEWASRLEMVALTTDQIEIIPGKNIIVIATSNKEKTMLNLLQEGFEDEDFIN